MNLLFFTRRQEHTSLDGNVFPTFPNSKEFVNDGYNQPIAILWFWGAKSLQQKWTVYFHFSQTRYTNFLWVSVYEQRLLAPQRSPQHTDRTLALQVFLASDTCTHKPKVANTFAHLSRLCAINRCF